MRRRKRERRKQSTRLSRRLRNVRGGKHGHGKRRARLDAGGMRRPAAPETPQKKSEERSALVPRLRQCYAWQSDKYNETSKSAAARKGTGIRSGVNRCAIEHNAAFCKVAAFTTLLRRFVRCNDRCAPFGFAERGVMSGAPPRMQPPACAAQSFGQALRAGDAHEKSARPTPRRASHPGLCARVPPAQGSSQALTRNHNDNKPRPPRPSRGAGSHSCLVAPSPRRMPSSRPPHRGSLIPVLRRALLRRLRHGRQAAAPQGNAKARSASGARGKGAPLHRMRKRLFSIAVKGPLRRCAPLTESAPQRRDRKAAAKEKTKPRTRPAPV